ncbi:MAG: hypothetical protein RBR42_00195 [Desulfomicrobium sp.]|nr:hypothetical protein [Desulfomicrobium sp.]NLV97181.1 hypothetical protein [Desulfovibrionales bacterium]
MEVTTTMITENPALCTTMFEATPHSLKSEHMFCSCLCAAAGGDLDLLSPKALWWWPRQHQPGEPAS